MHPMLRFRASLLHVWPLAILLGVWCLLMVPASPAAGASDGAAAAEALPPQTFNILEFQIEGATVITRADIEEAVYPHMGEDKTVADVEKARAALQELYLNKGYQALVIAPPQDPSDGTILLQVTEARIGRLRVVGARYHSPEHLKREVPSLAPGTIPNFNDVEREVSAAYRADREVNLSFREVPPGSRAGAPPGTVDATLDVKDQLPVHGTVEVNNRQSENTEALRTSVSLSYDNLWQLGHSISFFYQVAPEKPSNSEVYSGSYLARFPDLPHTSFLVYGLRSKSDVASVGGSNVIGDGKIIGGRVIRVLPGTATYYQSVSGGVDYKDFNETVDLNVDQIPTPITYYPFTIAYNGTFNGEDRVISGTASTTFAFPNFLNTSDEQKFDEKRYDARPSFIYFQAGLDNTETFPHDIIVFARVEGFVADGPLISNEQFAIGGQDTVRGFLEAIALGDFGTDGTLELRSPSVAGYVDERVNDWRGHVFVDAGSVGIYHPLEGQKKRFDLASVGFGSRIKVLNALNGSVDFAFPVILSGIPDDDTRNVLFRVWGEL